jgi:hypothetical protein
LIRSIARDERRLIDGLGQVIVGPGVEPGHHVLPIGPRCDQDDRDKRQALIRLQLFHRLDAVELWHLDVEKDKIG